MPVKFLTYSRMFEWGSNLKLEDECRFGMGVIYCYTYINNKVRKRLNKEYGINISKGTEVRSIYIEQLDYEDFDAKVDQYDSDFNKEEKKYKKNYKDSFSGLCKKTGIKF